MRSGFDRKIICSQPDNGFINLLLQTMTQQYISTFCERDKTPVNTLKSEKCTKHSKIEKNKKNWKTVFRKKKRIFEKTQFWKIFWDHLSAEISLEEI